MLCYHVESRSLRWVFRDGVVLKSLGCQVIGPCMVVGRHCLVSHYCHHCCRCVAASVLHLFWVQLEPSGSGRCSLTVGQATQELDLEADG